MLLVFFRMTMIPAFNIHCASRHVLLGTAEGRQDGMYQKNQLEFCSEGFLQKKVLQTTYEAPMGGPLPQDSLVPSRTFGLLIPTLSRMHSEP